MLDYFGVLEKGRILAQPLSVHLWGQAARALAEDGSPEAAEVLARAFVRASRVQRAILRPALLSLEPTAAIERAWACWVELRSDALAEVLSCRPLRLPCSVPLYVMSRLKSHMVEELRRQVTRDVLQALIRACADREVQIAVAASQLLQDMADHPLAAQSMALAVCQGGEKWRSVQACTQALAGVTSVPAVDALCAVWAKTRNRDLGRILSAGRRAASSPPSVYVLTRLKFARPALEPRPELAAPILAACDDPDRVIAGGALELLRHEDPAWRQALCQAVLTEDTPPDARRVLSSMGCSPRVAADRALFFLLTDQAEAALDLDFDLSMLSAAYRNGAPAVRRRVAAAIRRCRSRELTRILARRQGDNFEHLLMPDVDWETLIDGLDRPDRADELWSLMVDGPPAWSARIFGRLVAQGYRPAEDGREVWSRLMDLRGRVGKADWSVLEQSVGPTFRRQVLSLEAPQTGRRRAQRQYVPMDMGPSLAVAIDGAVQVWDCTDGSLSWSLTTAARSVALAGHTLAVGKGSQVEIWDTVERQHLRTLSTPHFQHLGLSADGLRLVTFDPGASRDYWELDTGRHAHMPQARKFDLASLSSDGRLIAVGRSDEWRVYEVDLDRSMDSFRMKFNETVLPGVGALAFSPDGSLLAVATRTGVSVYEMVTGARIGSIPGDGDVLAFDDDGRRLAVGGRTAIQVWEVATRSIRQAVKAMPLRLLRFAPGGGSLVGCTQDGELARWSLCSAPIASFSMGMQMEAEQRAKGPNVAWAYVSALMEYRRRYDIEIDDDVFVPASTDIELEFSSEV